MVTNQLMKREDGFFQRTKDQYFNANELLNYYNSISPKPKLMRSYTQNDSYSDYVDQLIKEGIESPCVTTTGRCGGTWMHPKLFVDFAMWLSVEFKSKVIGMVLDGLILSRTDAGDYYNQMCAQILESYVSFYNQKPPAKIYINEALMVRSLVTDKTDRNEMTEQELKQITYLQKVNANLISKNIGKDSRIRRLKEAAEIQI